MAAIQQRAAEASSIVSADLSHRLLRVLEPESRELLRVAALIVQQFPMGASIKKLPNALQSNHSIKDYDHGAGLDYSWR